MLDYLKEKSIRLNEEQILKRKQLELEERKVKIAEEVLSLRRQENEQKRETMRKQLQIMIQLFNSLNNKQDIL